MFQFLLQIWNWYTKDLLPRIRDRIGMNTQNPGFLFSMDGSKGDLMDLKPSNACGSPTVRLATDVFVKSVQWRKKTKVPNHEFLVCYVEERRISHGSIPRKSVILIDRNVTDVVYNGQENQSTGEPMDLIVEREDNKVNGRPESTARVSHTSGIQSIKSSSHKTLLAGDNMRFSLDGTDRFLHEEKWVSNTICKTLTINGEYMSVPQLAVLAHTVHNHHRSYELLAYQCYWYADIIYNTIQKIVEDSAGVLKKGFSPFDDKSHHPKTDVGYFRLEPLGPVKVKRGGPKTPEQVYQKYMENWDEMQAVIATLKAETNAQARMTFEPELAEAHKQAEKEKACRIAAEERLVKEKIAAEERVAKEKANTKAAEEQARRFEEELKQLKQQSAPGTSTHRVSTTRASAS